MVKKFIYGLVVLMTALLGSCRENIPQPADENSFIRGADLSFLPVLEENGAVYYNRDGKAKNVLKIFKDNGLNTVRLRLWVHPEGFHSSLQEVAAFAERVHASGLKVWLDLHYSDTWADPGRQTKPAAWNHLTLPQLEDTVFAYTRRVVQRIHPQYVQVGNEINNGFLWDEGRITHPQQFTRLLKKAIQAIRLSDPSICILLHYAGYSGAKSFFNLLYRYQVDFDCIGLSYYPWWHGKSLETLQVTIDQLFRLYHKKVVIAETAYPFTLRQDDDTRNVVGEKSQLIPEYPATQTGQEAFLQKLLSILHAGGVGGGICYWEPEWVSVKGSARPVGSPWENLTLFDFQHRTLSAVSVFHP